MNRYNIYRLDLLTKDISVLLIILLLAQPFYSFALTLDDEVEIGRNADKEVEKVFEVYEDKEVNKYVSSVGDKVVRSISDPEFVYNFKVLKSSMVNAFALPGGFVYVTTGILAVLNSEASLAGVLGHEIGHITSHHAVKQQRKAMAGMVAILAGLAASVAAPSMRGHSGELMLMTNSLIGQILLGYGREAEMESDRLGMVYAYNAGYNPSGIVDFLKNLKFQEMLEGRAYHGFAATHPDTKMRIIKAVDMAQNIKKKGKEVHLYKDPFLLHIKGIPYGGPNDKKDKRAALKKRYIDVYRAKGGEDIKDIARDVMNNLKDAFRVAVLNGKKEDYRLKKDELIKIIVSVRP